MAGMSGIGKLDRKYCYYSCGNRKHGCKKRNVDKLTLEDRVVATCQAMLTDENIDKISAMLAVACEESRRLDIQAAAFSDSILSKYVII